MEKQLLLAMVISLLALFAFEYYQGRRTGRASKKISAAPVAAIPAPATVPVLPNKINATQQLHIEGELYRATLDNKGGILTGWELKKYRSEGEKPFQMIDPDHGSDSQTYPGALLFDDPALTSLANQEYYDVQVLSNPGSFRTQQPPLTVVMRLVHGGLFVEKKYQFEKDNYLLDFSVTVTKNGRPLAVRILLGEVIGSQSNHRLNPSDPLMGVVYCDEKVRREDPPKKTSDWIRSEGNIRWIGLDRHYFAMVAIPAEPLTSFEFQRMGANRTDRDLLRIAIPQNGSAQIKMYLGPKEAEKLKAVQKADLDGLIDYGVFSFLVPPLSAALKGINRGVGNYGFSIIIMSFFLNLLLLPLRMKQTASMRKLAALQPEIRALQQRYSKYKKTDPRRLEMNREISELYRRNNASPLGGCLPNLLQVPFLWAINSLLSNSIDFRKAPFVGWIRDLSLKDPLYILPVLMGVSTLISQMTAPLSPGADPTQTRIMMFVLPLLLTYVFLNLASGLNLYFLCSNFFQIAFQKIEQQRYTRA